MKDGASMRRCTQWTSDEMTMKTGSVIIWLLAGGRSDAAVPLRSDILRLLTMQYNTL
jgi:hypothetical protein